MMRRCVVATFRNRARAPARDRFLRQNLGSDHEQEHEHEKEAAALMFPSLRREKLDSPDGTAYAAQQQAWLAERFRTADGNPNYALTMASVEAIVFLAIIILAAVGGEKRGIEF